MAPDDIQKPFISFYNQKPGAPHAPCRSYHAPVGLWDYYRSTMLLLISLGPSPRSAFAFGFGFGFGFWFWFWFWFFVLVCNAACHISRFVFASMESAQSI